VCSDGESLQVADREGRRNTQGARLGNPVVCWAASVQEDSWLCQWGCDLAAGQADDRRAGPTQLCWWGRGRWKVQSAIDFDVRLLQVRLALLPSQHSANRCVSLAGFSPISTAAEPIHLWSLHWPAAAASVKRQPARSVYTASTDSALALSCDASLWPVV